MEILGGGKLGWVARVLSFFAVTGCGRAAPRGVAKAPPGGRWESARVETETKRAGIRGSDMGPRRAAGAVRQTLVLQRGGTEHRLPLDQAGDWEGEAFTRLKKARYELCFAPDNHALALSTDGGTHWRYVALDSETPFYCRHAAFASGAGRDPFASAPTTRDLVLEILASSTQPGVTKGRNHVNVWPETGMPQLDESPERVWALETHFIPELRGATRYVLAHPGDAELRAALTRAVLLPGRQLGTHADEVIAAVAQMGREHTDVRALLLSAVDGSQYARAVLALAAIPDAVVQDRLAALLSSLASSTQGEDACDRHLLLTYALTANVHAHRQATLPAARALSLVAKGSAPCPLKQVPGAREIVSRRGQTARRLAVQGLAVVGTPEARELLAELARGPCRAHARRDGADEILNEHHQVQWPATVGSFSEETTREDMTWSDLACWAQAALASQR